MGNFAENLNLGNRFRPPLLPNRVCVYILTEKGLKLCKLWFPKIHILFRKEVLPPCDHLKSYISVNLDLKGPKIMHIKLTKYKNFLGKGALPPLQPHSGPAPWTPVNASCKRSGCSLRSQLFEPPPHVENLPKPMKEEVSVLYNH